MVNQINMSFGLAVIIALQVLVPELNHTPERSLPHDLVETNLRRSNAQVLDSPGLQGSALKDKQVPLMLSPIPGNHGSSHSFEQRVLHNLTLISLRYGRRLSAHIDWTLPQYYATASAIAIGGNLYYFHRGVDGIVLEVFYPSIRIWAKMPEYVWLTDADGWGAEMYYATIRLEAIGSVLYVFGRGPNYTYLSAFDTATQTWTLMPSFSYLRDADGFTVPEHYFTVRMKAIEPSLYIVARGNSQTNIAGFNVVTKTWTLLPPLTTYFVTESVWSQAIYYESFRLNTFGNVLYWFVRGSDSAHLVPFDTITNTWGSISTCASFLDAYGWLNPQYYNTMQITPIPNYIYVTGRGISDVLIRRFNPKNGGCPQVSQIPGYTDADHFDQPQNYLTIQYQTTLGQLYLMSRSPAGLVPYVYNPTANTWSALATFPSMFTDAGGWNQPSLYLSIKFVAIGSHLYVVGRDLFGVQLGVYDIPTNIWTQIPAFYCPCDSACQSYLGIGGYFTSPSVCFGCDITCQSCAGPGFSLCLSCRANAALSSTAPSSCHCNIGYYVDSRSGSCFPCDQSCYTCLGPGSSQCLGCKSNALLNGVAPSSCQCQPYAFTTSDVSNCELCDPTCQSCTFRGSGFCQTCKANAILASTAPASCICSAGFYTLTDASQCLPCNNTCGSCVNPIECLSCKANASLNGTVCQCVKGFYPSPDASNCVSCSFACSLCTFMGCSKCVSGFYFLNSTCWVACPDGYVPTSVFECKQLDLTTPIPTLTVTQTNDLLVTFNTPMNLNLITADIDIIISTPNNLEVISTWSNPVNRGSNELLISLIMSATYIPEQTQVELRFVHPEKVISISGIPIKKVNCTATLHSFGSAPRTSALQTAAGQSASTSTASTAIIAAVASVVTGNLSNLMSLFNQMEIISFIAMSKIPIPDDFYNTLAGSNLGLSIQLPIPNLINSTALGQDPPNFIQTFGVSTTLFLNNSAIFLTSAIAMFISIIPIYYLSKVNNQKIAKYFSEKLPAFKWNVPLMLWLTSYLDTAIYSFLQISNIQHSTEAFISAFSLVLALIFGIGVVSTPFLLSRFMYQHYDNLTLRTDPEFNKRWGSLVDEFTPNPHFSSIAYYWVFVIRRIVFGLALIIAQNYLTVIAILVSSTSFAVSCIQAFLCLALSRPHKRVLDQIGSALTESFTFLSHLSATSFAYNLSSSLACVIEQIGIWSVRGALFVNIGISLYGTFTSLYHLIKVYSSQVKVVARPQGLQVMWKRRAL